MIPPATQNSLLVEWLISFQTGFPPVLFQSLTERTAWHQWYPKDIYPGNFGFRDFFILGQIIDLKFSLLYSGHSVLRWRMTAIPKIRIESLWAASNDDRNPKNLKIKSLELMLKNDCNSPKSGSSHCGQHQIMTEIPRISKSSHPGQHQMMTVNPIKQK